MAVCNDKVCDAVLCEECKLNPIPKICGKSGVTFTESVCDGLKLIGADDVTINQGVGIDLSQGVHAYDGNGNEIEYTFVPSEIPKCAVGEHTVKYTVVGVANKMRPTICQRDRLHISSTCNDLDTLVKNRVVIIKQADPPKISGVEILTIEPNTDFNPMDGVSAVDDNGNTVDVEFDGEHTKEASGEIASFETSLLKYMPKVKVTLEPIQDGTPWIDDNDYTVPYLLKASPRLEEEYNHESLSLVGGTVAWNQQENVRSRSASGLTATVDSNFVVTLSGTPSVAYVALFGIGASNGIKDHVYLIYNTIVANPNNLTVRIGALNSNINNTGGGTIRKLSADVNYNTYGIQGLSTTTDYTGFKFQTYCCDLTQMFGSTIADYIYSLEQANAGAGVAFFKSLGFDADYYPYNQGQLMSVKTSGHKIVGFNQWDEEWEVGAFDAQGEKLSASNRIRSKNFIKVLPQTTYYAKVGALSNVGYTVLFYDADKEFISLGYPRTANIFTTPTSAHYINIAFPIEYGTTYGNNICINISDPSRNGRYEPYESTTYPLDADLELRGLFKLDANNKIYNDGDLYPPSGKVSRRYGIVDLGTLNWIYNGGLFRATPTNFAPPSSYNARKEGFLFSSKYSADTQISIDTSTMTDKTALRLGGIIYIKDAAYSDATTFKSAMSGVYLVYELATPTTENADPYTSPQIAISGGTEEFIDTRTVPIPVGNKTRYMRIVPIEGHDEVTVHTSSNNLVNEDAIFGDNGGIKQPNGSWYIADQRTLRNKVFFYNNGYEGQFTVTWIHRDTGGATWGTYPIVVYTDGLVETISMTKSTNAFRTETLVTRANRVVDHFEFTYASNNAGYYYLQLELGSTATEYQPYQGNDYTTDLGQTVYGGTLDVASGKLAFTYGYVDMGMLNWSYINQDSTTKGFYAFLPTLKTGYPLQTEKAPLICSKYATGGIQWANISDGQIGVNGTVTGSTTQLIVKDSYYTDASTFKSSLNGTQLVYELAEPQTYWLTPQQVNSIVGENNVWSDHGDISVEYWEKMPNETVQLLEGVYHITYTAEDECGNETEVTRDIIVGDGNVLCKARICEAITECGYS